MGKNLTLTVEEELLDAVKLIAAQERTSVNAMVRQFFRSIVERKQKKDDAREALLKLARESTGDMGTRTWSREALYDR